MPFLLAEILNFQGSTHRIGVGSFSKMILEICTEYKNMMYYANMQAEILRETGYVIGKNASFDSRHLLFEKPVFTGFF